MNGWTQAVRRWWRRHVAMDSQVRTMCYRILDSQTRGGMSLIRICELLQDKQGIDPSIRQLAQAGARAGNAGRLVSQGFEESGFLPQSDAGVLAAAERNRSVLDALEDLMSEARASRNLWSAMLRPSLFQFVPLIMALGMVTASPLMLQEIVVDTSILLAVPLYQVAEILRSWGLPVLVVAALAFAAVMWGRYRWTGTLRRALLIFDHDWRAQVAIQYCRLAASMTRQGATHLETLDAFSRVNRSRYVKAQLPAIRRDIAEGRAYWQSLAGRMLTDENASLLDSLVPGEDRTRYPSAFDTLARMQEAELDHLYTVRARGLKLALMLTSGALIVLMMHGIFEAAKAVMTQMGGVF